MGTNFYDLKGKHIGKRSAAGLFCWDCDTTLCKGGRGKVHEGCTCSDRRTPLEQIRCDRHWYKECPDCKQKPSKETLDDNSAGRELGFNKQVFKQKKGVASCSSFTWAVYPDTVWKKRFIKDEYGRRYSMKEFKKVLQEYPIQYFDSIGREFS